MTAEEFKDDYPYLYKRFVLNLTEREIATEENVSERTVRNRMSVEKRKFLADWESQ